MEKKKYSGLMTNRVKVTCQPIMATSESKLKVKTVNAEGASEEWHEDNTAGTLTTTITSDL